MKPECHKRGGIYEQPERLTASRRENFSVENSKPYLDFLCLLLRQSQSHFTTDGQSVCLSWCRAPYGTHGQILVNV
jgi:hypothetical protein